MRQKVTGILIILLFAAGICLLVYPFISDWFSDQAQTTVVDNYERTVTELNDEDHTALWEAAQSYNKGLLNNVILTDPFDSGALSELSNEYQSLLDINGDGVMGYIVIPKIEVRLPVYHGTETEVMKKGAGHLENTSLPVGGEDTHAVISAHSGLPSATLFTNLSKLKEGDLFFMEVLGDTLAYRVNQVKVVEPSNTSDLLIVNGEDYVTLVTCTPYGINSHRLLVRGTRTEYAEELEAEVEEMEQAKQEQVQRDWPLIIAVSAGVTELVVFAVLYFRLRKRGRQ